jgi:hypothetical protein
MRAARLLIAIAAVSCHGVHYYQVTLTRVPRMTHTIEIDVDGVPAHTFTVNRPEPGIETFSLEVSSRPALDLDVYVYDDAGCELALGTARGVIDNVTIELDAINLPCVVDGGVADAALPDGPLPDAGPPDAALPDAAPPFGAPTLIRPQNGASTGLDLRPVFAWTDIGATYYSLEMYQCPSWPCSFPTGALPVETVTGTTTYQPSVALTVSSTPPVGARYLWRVAACEGARCGPFSAPRYLDVGRMPDDFDGDGYADVAVADSTETLVFRGQPGATLAATASTGMPVGPLATYDVNADGFGDLIIGDPANEQVLVYFGRTGGGFDGPGVVGELDPGFGTDVAVADVDGDGLGEIIAAVPDDKVAIWGDVTLTGATNVNAIYPTSSVGFARTVAAGDLDDDGLADVVVGAPAISDVSTGSGELFAYLSGSGGASGPLHGLGMLQSAGIGTSLLVGDVDGDGASDVLAGGPGNASGDGAVFYYAGNRGALPATDALAWADPNSAASASYGASLAYGLGPMYAVGAPGEGVVYVNSSGTVQLTCYDPSATGKCAGSQLGAKVVITDANGDGQEDVIACAPGFGGGAGALIYYSSAPALPAVYAAACTELR